MRLIRESDISSLNKWLKRRGALPVSFSDLPKLTYIIPGVAVAGLRTIEGGMGILDSICTNNFASTATRHRALETLYETLLNSGCTTVLGFTEDASTYQRALRHGFRPYDQIVLIRKN